MAVADDREIVEARTRVLAGTREFMRDHDASYDESHVAACEAILAKFLEPIERAVDRATGLELVRNAVTALNEPNGRCDHGLIETDQREDLCAVILRAGALRGFHGAHEDVTEQWREW